MELTAELVFDAAHRILGHAGKCAYLHGHTYRIEVTVSAPALDRLGMVIDFDDLRAMVKKAVVDRWNHATLLSGEDPLADAVASVQAEAPEKVVRFPGNPTAELLTLTAWELISQALPPGLTLERVVIKEGPGCSSAISRERR
jgi:6-pyruvoyltetrahydropterin/6-carboxytetrahydropterin synthase